MSLLRPKQARRADSVHRDNIRKSLERRLEAARSQNNQALVNQLEAEASYLGI
ncbi:MAG: hypothetical protein HC796_09575 [Synechococcaceae cyanobacterium RL_1_2]|jgi:hypothetical protein|nr:hypothetical protein [Synechococcaceae cyanobacterium RL_1_2]